jgi:hypothetical protein
MIKCYVLLLCLVSAFEFTEAGVARFNFTESPVEYVTYKVKANKKWAIRNDLVLVIAFVLICVGAYKTLIQGAFFGVAINPVSEVNNESYTYWSSEDESESEEEDSSQGLPSSKDKQKPNPESLSSSGD